MICDVISFTTNLDSLLIIILHHLVLFVECISCIPQRELKMSMFDAVHLSWLSHWLDVRLVSASYGHDDALFFT